METNLISLGTANKMLSLMTPIVLDLKEKWEIIDKSINTDNLKDGISLQKTIKTICRRVDEIEDLGCFLENIEEGVVDIPSKIDGERVMLCWQIGEEEILYYHKRGESKQQRLLIKQVLE